MTPAMTTCTCGGEIRPSYIGPAPIIGALAAKGEITYPAACQQCKKTYPDTVSISMTAADLGLVSDRISPSTRQELAKGATEISPGSFQIELPEDRAIDLASKAANLGLLTIAATIRRELSALALLRRQRA
jgi:hypothetical protein